MRTLSSAFLLASMFLALASGPAMAEGTIDVNIDPAAGKTISVRGSYRLVADVTMTNDVAAITIAPIDVTIDLNGHTITAFSTTTRNGIDGQGTADRMVIYNGRVRGFGGFGVTATGNGQLVRDVTVEGCNKLGGKGGIEVGPNSVVERCVVKSIIASTGSSFGILLNGANSRAENNTVSDVTGTTGLVWGITLVGTNLKALNNSVMNVANSGNDSSARGIRAVGVSIIISRNSITNISAPGTGSFAEGIITQEGSGMIISENTIQGCSSGQYCLGISAGPDTTIENNVITGNSCSASSGGPCFGIQAGNGCLIRRNICSSNTHSGNGDTYGIKAGGGCTIESNVVRNNTEGQGNAALVVGIFAGPRTNVIANTCTENNAVGGGGDAYGIELDGAYCSARDNICANNLSQGGKVAAGINLTNAATGCRVVNNTCMRHFDSTTGSGYGLWVRGVGNIISGNTTGDNSTFGIHVDSNGHRFELNRHYDPIEEGTPGLNSVGTGEFANIAF